MTLLEGEVTGSEGLRLGDPVPGGARILFRSITTGGSGPGTNKSKGLESMGSSPSVQPVRAGVKAAF